MSDFIHVHVQKISVDIPKSKKEARLCNSKSTVAVDLWSKTIPSPKAIARGQGIVFDLKNPWLPCFD